jgi:hypothetical protein
MPTIPAKWALIRLQLLLLPIPIKINPTANAMTPHQSDKLKKKIADIKRILVAEKRKFGCYDDSRGLRYLPAGYFVRRGDYAGGLAYLRWFNKTFPDDSGVPEFLFESAILLFKTGRRQEAGNAVFRTFCSNPYWIDRFLGRPLTPLNIWHSSNLTKMDYTEALAFFSNYPDLADFSAWLQQWISTEDFTRHSNRYLTIYGQLRTESDRELRRLLVQEAFQLEHAKF